MSELVDNKELLIIIKEMFLAYSDRKKRNILYSSDQDIPKTLIKLYYELNKENRNLNDLQDNFIQHYIEGECTLENTHEPFEKEGLKVMYDYIHSEESDYRFDIYTLLELHRRLYSEYQYDIGGTIRNATARINNAPVDLVPYYEIRNELNEADIFLSEIMQLGQQVNEDKTLIFDYIKKCIELKCKLIKIHPFFDGNGRSIRGFINKLFLNVGLPSVYISENENVQYRQAMQKAIGEENDNSSIIQFYYYKICDSIFELDIYPKLYKEKFDLPRNVMKLANECTERLANEELSPKRNKEVCDVLESKLKEMGINYDRRCTTQFNQDAFPHDFILVCYKTVDDNKLIIDPMFAALVRAGKIDDKPTSAVLKNIMYNLKTSGVASASNIEISDYIDLFADYEKSNQKPATMVKRPQ